MAFSSLIVLRTAGLLSKSAERPLTQPALEMTHATQQQADHGAQPVEQASRTLKEIAQEFADKALLV